MEKELMLIEILKLSKQDQNIEVGKFYKVFSSEYIDGFIDENGVLQEISDFIITIKDDIGEFQEMMLSDCKIIEEYDSKWRDYFEDVYWID